MILVIKWQKTCLNRVSVLGCCGGELSMMKLDIQLRRFLRKFEEELDYS